MLLFRVLVMEPRDVVLPRIANRSEDGQVGEFFGQEKSWQMIAYLSSCWKTFPDNI